MAAVSAADGAALENDLRIAEINDVASVASELSTGLRARGHDVVLFQPKLAGGHLPGLIKPAVVPMRALEWAQLVRSVRAGHFDVLHIHYAYIGMVGVLSGLPYILHCHGSDVWGLTPITRWPATRALKGAAHVFYSTPDLAVHTLRHRPDAEFLPNPIDWRTFAPTQGAGESSDVYVACALDDLKGGPRILDACRRLAELRPGVRVTVTARGKYVPEFAALPNVSVIPAQERAALPGVINRHGIVIGQVNLGAAGMAELEAMSCARPVVASFTYGTAYPEPPPFVQANTGSGIAEAVVRLLDDEALRRRTGEEGREWIQRYHDFDAIVDRVEAVARRAVEGGRAKAMW